MDRPLTDHTRLAAYFDPEVVENEAWNGQGDVDSHNVEPSTLTSSSCAKRAKNVDNAPPAADAVPDLCYASCYASSSSPESQHELENEWGQESPPDSSFIYALPHTEEDDQVVEPEIVDDPGAPDSPLSHPCPDSSSGESQEYSSACSSVSLSHAGSDDNIPVTGTHAPHFTVTSTIQHGQENTTPQGSPSRNAFLSLSHGGSNSFDLPIRSRSGAVPPTDESARNASTQTDPDDTDDDDSDGLLMADYITDDTAQRHLPPEACLFAANLPMAWMDEKIKQALEKELLPFGQVFVKVKRDPTNLPVAFLQFTSYLDAMEVLKNGNGFRIGRRPTRIEQARCDRTLFCSPKCFEGIGSPEFAAINSLVKQYGPVEKIWHIPQDDADYYHLPHGVWIRFRHYGTCQDAFKGLQNHFHFRFELIRKRHPQLRHMPFPFSTVLNRDNATFQHGSVSLRGRLSSPIYGSVIGVEGLPGSTSSFQIGYLFAYFGQIHHINFGMDHLFRTTTTDVPFRTCTVAFVNRFAGPAAWAFCSRFGMAVQDASRLTWSNISVHVLHVTDEPRPVPVVEFSPVGETAFANLDMGEYLNYLRSLKHPAYMIPRHLRTSPHPTPHWQPAMDFRYHYEDAQIAACAPLLGAPASEPQIRSLNNHPHGHQDPRTGAWVPHGSRAENYATLQGYGEDDWLEPVSRDEHGRPAYDVSGISPLR